MADRETIIDNRGGGMGAGVIVGILVAVALVIGVVWYMNNSGGGTRTVDVDVPAVSVDVVPDGQ